MLENTRNHVPQCVRTIKTIFKCYYEPPRRLIHVARASMFGNDEKRTKQRNVYACVKKWKVFRHKFNGFLLSLKQNSITFLPKNKNMEIIFCEYKKKQNLQQF